MKLRLALALVALVVACSSSGGSSSSGGVVTTDLGPGDPGPGGVRFAASGEVLALSGYDFPPTTDAPAFVDGWEVKFKRLIVTVDHVTLNDKPGLSPGDQSQTGGLLVKLDGPWAIDLAHSDPGNLAGKGGPGEQAVPFASVKSSDLDTNGTTYAFGYDVVTATAAAKRVNLAGDASADYDKMIAAGCSVYYAGTATFKGDKSDPACYPADRQGWPDVVDFQLCFRSPTTYENCQNPDNDPAAPLAGEEHARGIALKGDSSVIAQVTIHTDHPFWDSIIHDAPAHFDQFAARVVGQPTTPTPIVTLEMTQGVDYTGYTDAAGKALQWRYCIDPPEDAHPKFIGAMAFDPGAAKGAIKDYYQFATYDQSTQGHLNSDGLCFVKRNY